MVFEWKFSCAFLERVINAQTGTEDSMASQMFCMIVKNDADLISAAHEMLVKKMYSTNTEEALRAVSVSDSIYSNTIS